MGRTATATRVALGSFEARLILVAETGVAAVLPPETPVIGVREPADVATATAAIPAREVSVDATDVTGRAEAAAMRPDGRPAPRPLPPRLSGATL